MTIHFTTTHPLQIDGIIIVTSLVGGNEGLHLPNIQTKLLCAHHKLSLMFWYFINTAAYPLGRYKPASPST